VSPKALGASVELATWCTAGGIEPVLESSDAVAAGLGSFAVTAAEIGEPVLAVALGGDGTILKTVHLIGDADVPLLGVKFGRLGFLSGARAEAMREAVQVALSGEAAIERRATLLATVVMDGRSVGSYRALNEVVVGRGLTGRVVAFELAIDGHRLMNTHADAMIVATATGSTAYALSAGGPVVAPGFGGMVVVPVAPHTLAVRSIVTDPAGTVEITLPDPTRADACITVDGDAKPCRRSIEKVTVSRGAHDVSLVKLDGRDFYETAAVEFFGG
jgi:NAD+ kinase